MQPMTDNNLSSLMEEARSRLGLLRDNLPTVVEAAAVSTIAKMPFKALWCRESLIWRAEEMGRTAYNSYERGDVVAGILLTRGLTETTAALWYLKELIERQLANGLDQNLDKKLMALLFGQRTVNDLPAAINVLTFVDRTSKSIPALKEAYDSMCEYSHPNWAGSGFAFSKANKEDHVIRFGRKERENGPHLTWGVRCLVAALTTLEIAYSGSADAMPKFIELCEADLRAVRR
jgi:hypothetical protein